MNWELIDDFTIYVCTECGNDITIVPGNDPPEKCPYCIGEKISRKDIIKKLALELYSRGACIPNYKNELCKKYYIMNSPKGCVNC